MKIINPIVTFLVASFFSLCLMTCDLGGDVDFEQGSMQKLGTFSRITETNEIGESIGAVDSDDWGCSNNLSSGKTTKGGPLLPEGFVIYAAYPNPTNGVTTIRYDLPEESHVTIKIYKSNMGSVSLVRTLANYSTQSAGFRAIQWDGQNDNGHKVMPGIYRCVMTININEYTYFECYGDIQIHETFRL